MAVQLAAYLKMCPYEQEHGCFVLPDGESSSEFCHREGALSVLNELVEEKKITQEEKTYLSDCVRRSKLPRREDASIEMLNHCRYVNNRDIIDGFPEDESTAGAVPHSIH